MIFEVCEAKCRILRKKFIKVRRGSVHKARQRRNRRMYARIHEKKKGYSASCNPAFIGVPETIRTSDPFLRREVLYPAELRGQIEVNNPYTRVAPLFQACFKRNAR